MNVVDLKKQNQIRKEAIQHLELIIENTTIKNAAQIKHTIQNRGKNETELSIVQYYVDFLLSQILLYQDKQQLIDSISSGVIFEARRMFIERVLEEVNKTDDCLLFT